MNPYPFLMHIDYSVTPIIDLTHMIMANGHSETSALKWIFNYMSLIDDRAYGPMSYKDKLLQDKIKKWFNQFEGG